MTPQDPTSPNPPPHGAHPLDAEERALAERLARLGPHGEPSPALDSRILSAAHAAVHRRAAGSDTRRKPRVRWSVNLGIAASLVLALGLAWQLRPLPDATVAYRSEADSALAGATPEAKQESRPGERQMAPLPMAIPHKPAPAADRAPDADRDTGDDEDRFASVAPPPEQPPATATQETKPARKLQSPPPPPAPPVPPVPPVPKPAPVSDAPMPAAKALNPPSPAAPIIAPAPIPAPASTSTTESSVPVAAAEARAFSTGTSAAETAAASATQSSAWLRKQADARDKATATPTLGTVDNLQPEAFNRPQADNAVADDMPDQDVPPATVASPIVRDAWLARIRELAADGRVDEARASLKEFRVRYPRYQLPDDLRALAQKTWGPSVPEAQTPGSDTTDP